MTKENYAATQRVIEEFAAKWQRILRLGDRFEIEHVFLDSYFGDDGEEDFKITATTETRWNYGEAKIKWYMPSAVRHPLAKLEGTVVHELCHVILAAMESHVPDKYAEQCEYTTELVSRLLIAAYMAGRHDESVAFHYGAAAD